MHRVHPLVAAAAAVLFAGSTAACGIGGNGTPKTGNVAAASSAPIVIPTSRDVVTNPATSMPSSTAKPANVTLCGRPVLKLNTPRNQVHGDNIAVVPDGSKGIDIQVSVTLLGAGCSIWAFDHGVHSDDPNYYLDDNNEHHAAAVTASNGAFVFRDQPVGSKGDENERYEVVFVLATPDCAAVLRQSVQNNDGDVTYAKFPAGCTRLGAQQLEVNRL